MKNDRRFKGAVIISVFLHVLVLLLLIFSPSLPRPTKKGTIYYLPLSLVGPPGGGGGSGGGGGGGDSPSIKTSTSKQPSLRELTSIQKKATEPPASSLRYPVEKKPSSKKTPEKKTVISKPQPESSGSTEERGTGIGLGAGGSGIRIGVGSGPGGPGFGSGGAFDLSAFPFTYYLQIIQDKISLNWFTSLIDPGGSGQYQCMIFFKIWRDGRISDLQVEVSSGSRAFDLSALRAVQNASPLPPLPKEFEGEYLGVHLIFEHVK